MAAQIVGSRHALAALGLQLGDTQRLAVTAGDLNALLSGGNPVIQFLNVAIMTPFIEEMIFRGLIFTRLSRGMRQGTAILLSALFFGMAHGHVVGFIYATLLGVIFAFLMKKHRDSILAPFLCHMGFNGTSFLITLLPDNTLLILAVYLIGIAAALLLGYFLFRKSAETNE